MQQDVETRSIFYYYYYVLLVIVSATVNVWVFLDDDSIDFIDDG